VLKRTHIFSHFFLVLLFLLENIYFAHSYRGKCFAKIGRCVPR
jgi:hypothetical protein